MFGVILVFFSLTFTGDALIDNGENLVKPTHSFLENRVNQEWLGHESGQKYGWGNETVDKFGNKK